MNKKIVMIVFIVIMALLFTSCQTKDESQNKTENLRTENQIPEKMSISKYSEVTKKHYEETDNDYKAAFYSLREINIDEINDWIKVCKNDGKYYRYIYSDPDSYDLFLYYQFPENENVDELSFKFYVEDSTVKVFVSKETREEVKTETVEESEEQVSYFIIRVQAPSRGKWPSDSELYIDDVKIEQSDIIGVS